MAVIPQATPLLLTKRLNAFLRAHATPQLPTLLLTTHHGKLLAHASLSTAAQPVAVLRTHATVAASLLAIHTASSAALPGAVGGSTDSSTAIPTDDDDESSSLPEDDDDDVTARGTDDDEVDSRHPHAAAAAAAAAAGPAVKPVTITVQLSGGTVIIRRLRCGLLFVCVGPSSSSHDAGASALASSSSGALASSSAAGVADLTQTLEGADLLSAETESLTSVGGQASATSGDSAAAAAAIAPSASSSSSASSSGSSVVAMRRHAAELARWLDDKLGTLTVPEDRTGAE